MLKYISRWQMLDHNLTARAFLIGVSLVLVSGCDTFGSKKHQLDEFQVIARAPLSMPPSATLRPPQPGELRPQEGSAVNKARSKVFGSEVEKSVVYNPAGSSVGEVALLKRAGADKSVPNIRALVDEETSSLVRADDTLVEQLIFWRSEDQKRQGPTRIVDASAEAERISRNAALGLPVEQGETPDIEKKGGRGGLLDGLF